MKFFNKTIYAFSLFKTYRIYFGTEDQDDFCIPDRIEVIIPSPNNFWINCLLEVEKYSDGTQYSYLSFDGHPVLTKENFFVNLNLLYKINIEKSINSPQDCRWDIFL